MPESDKVDNPTIGLSDFEPTDPFVDFGVPGSEGEQSENSTTGKTEGGASELLASEDTDSTDVEQSDTESLENQEDVGEEVEQDVEGDSDSSILQRFQPSERFPTEQTLQDSYRNLEREYHRSREELSTLRREIEAGQRQSLPTDRGPDISDEDMQYLYENNPRKAAELQIEQVLGSKLGNIEGEISRRVDERVGRLVAQSQVNQFFPELANDPNGEFSSTFAEVMRVVESNPNDPAIQLVLAKGIKAAMGEPVAMNNQREQGKREGKNLVQGKKGAFSEKAGASKLTSNKSVKVTDEAKKVYGMFSDMLGDGYSIQKLQQNVNKKNALRSGGE